MRSEDASRERPRGAAAQERDEEEGGDGEADVGRRRRAAECADARLAPVPARLEVAGIADRAARPLAGAAAADARVLEGAVAAVGALERARRRRRHAHVAGAQDEHLERSPRVLAEELGGAGRAGPADLEVARRADVAGLRRRRGPPRRIARDAPVRPGLARALGARDRVRVHLRGGGVEARAGGASVVARRPRARVQLRPSASGSTNGSEWTKKWSSMSTRPSCGLSAARSARIARRIVGLPAGGWALWGGARVPGASRTKTPATEGTRIFRVRERDRAGAVDPREVPRV